MAHPCRVAGMQPTYFPETSFPRQFLRLKLFSPTFNLKNDWRYGSTSRKYLSPQFFRALPDSKGGNGGMEKLQISTQTSSVFSIAQNDVLSLRRESELEIEKENEESGSGQTNSSLQEKKLTEDEEYFLPPPPPPTFLDGSIKGLLESTNRAFEETPVKSIATTAFYAGVLALGGVFSLTVLNSLENAPFLPQAFQTIGIGYCMLVAGVYLVDKRFYLPSSPIKGMLTIMDGPSIAKKRQEASSFPSLALDEKVGARLRSLTEQRDAAVAQVEEYRKTGYELGKAVAEKEALEAVAKQLAEERDYAVSEVTALKTAVNAMTDRMRSIEAMLSQEVQRLQEQNLALENVALQLAEERDIAIKQAEELRKAFEDQRNEDKKILETLATQLIQERDAAISELEELKQVVASLSQANEYSSGLTPEMETFIKSRARSLRAQFVDITKSYENQKEAVDEFVSHLVEEYGAPREWTSMYIKQFLNASDKSYPNPNGPV